MSTPAEPPLTRWASTWRYVGAVAITGLVGIEGYPHVWDVGRAWFVADVVAGLVAFLLMPYRRNRPVLVAAVVALISSYSVTAAGPGVVTLMSLATHRRWRQILPVALLGMVTSLVIVTVAPLSSPEPWLVTAGFVVIFTVGVVAAGLYVGARRELVASLQDRAERAEREQSLRVAQARSTERARIAREMHDVLAHRMSLVAMHAGGLAYRTDLPGDEVRRTASVIQDNAHRALTDLRAVLGLLREEDGAGAADPERPQPTLRDLPDLVTEARAAGMRVTLTDAVQHAEDAPDAIGRHAYRMVQEGLTNARKHAPHAPVEVSVAGAPADGLRVEVRNPLPLGAARTTTPASGLGLVGLAERAALSGGRLEHEVRGNAFVVRAWLPWEPESAVEPTTAPAS